MKRWLIPTVALIIGAVIASLIALVIILHPWGNDGSSDVMPNIVQPTAEPQPAFHIWDVQRLAQEQVALLPFPEDTKWVKCVDASYRSGNRRWVVTCEYGVEQEFQQATAIRTFLFDDQTGRLTP
jgi:hypothetical protein